MAQPLRSDERAWRALTEAANAPQGRAGELLRLVKATAGRAIPADTSQDQAAFAALQALARAYAMAKPNRRERLRPCLSGLATECSKTVGWNVDPVPAEPPEEPPSWERRDLFDFGPETRSKS